MPKRKMGLTTKEIQKVLANLEDEIFDGSDSDCELENEENDLDQSLNLNLEVEGEKVGSLMIYVKQEELGDYEKVKQLVLKQFQPTPRVLLNQFRMSQKLPNENYVQFASRIEAMFDY
ncbi:hypothetical protein TNCV_949671 [Trichonephila clavipes]|nr:hypothetical protein TNCV_949671 [Trichonephila clavipes]